MSFVPRVKFLVEGRPRPGGSKRPLLNKKTGKMFVVDMSGQPGKLWRKTVQAAAQTAWPNPPLSEPVHLECRFFLQRPKGHFHTDGTPREDAPWFPVVPPDTTKLLRAVEDALNGVLWLDDKQVVQQVAGKCYTAPGLPEGVLILVSAWAG